MLYLHSTYHVEPGKMDEYLDIVERRQLPYGEAQGLHLVGYWQSGNVPGPPTDLIAVYAMDGWHTWANIMEKTPNPEIAALGQEYMAKAQFLRPKYESKFMTPVRFSPLQ
jgi:hypothetical protein